LRRSVWSVEEFVLFLKPEPFGNLPCPKTFFDGSRLGIYFFVKWEPNGLRPYYYYNVLMPLAVRKYSDGAARGDARRCVGFAGSETARTADLRTGAESGGRACHVAYSQQLFQRILFYYNIFSTAHVITTRHYDNNNINVVVRFPAGGPRRSGTCWTPLIFVVIAEFGDVTRAAGGVHPLGVARPRRAPR